ncbi:MAG: beta-L-arabinofuranosidase domain-containing protein [Anaerolineae bacterium]
MEPRLLPVPLAAVDVNDCFWAPRQQAVRSATLPNEYEQCLATGRIDAWRLLWRPGDPNPPHIFWDSDVAKWIEAAAYSLTTHPDVELERLVDGVVELIAAAQQPDGYLNTHFTVVEPEKRWTNLRDWHELYCAGHLIEAAMLTLTSLH